MMARRGFSLLEVAVASAMAGVVGAAAVAAFAALNQSLVRLQSESVASDNAKSLVDILVTDFQGVGGGPVRPWMAFWLEDGKTPSPRDGAFIRPPGLQSDRVTIATTIADTPSCTVVGMTAGTITADGIGPSCCLTQLMDLGSAPSGLVAHLFVIKADRHRQISISSVDSGTCTATFLPGPLSPIDNPQPPTLDFGDGTIVAAEVKTIFLNANRELVQFQDVENINGGSVTIDPGETSVIAGGVYDFQVQAGYDFASDGRIVDLASSTDEWLYNNAADDPLQFRAEDLRMVGVGVVIGIRVTDPNYRSTARIIDGTLLSLSQVHLRGAMSKAALRNLFIFF
jgi:prepilin-type N-terminal cleavage/methylation domain-containing protein